MTKKFVIYGRLWGLNEIVNHCKSPQGQRIAAGYKRETEENIGWYIKKYLGNWRTDKQVFIKYLWVEPNYRRDKDNIAAGRKFIQDALVKCGVLENDGWKNIEGFSDEFAVDKENPRIEVEITEL